MHNRIGGAALLLVTMGCQNHEPVARVNGTAISYIAFRKAVERDLARHAPNMPPLSKEVKERLERGVLQRLVDDEVFSQRAKADGVTVSEDEVEARFVESRMRFASDATFAEYLKRTGSDEASLRGDLRQQLLRERLIGKLTGNLPDPHYEATRRVRSSAKVEILLSETGKSAAASDDSDHDD